MNPTIEELSEKINELVIIIERLHEASTILLELQQVMGMRISVLGARIAELEHIPSDTVN